MDIKARLLEEAQEGYKKFNSTLIPNIDNVLLISSSCYASENQEEETKAIKTTNYLEKGISTGAELTVDDLILLYE